MESIFRKHSLWAAFWCQPGCWHCCGRGFVLSVGLIERRAESRRQWEHDIHVLSCSGPWYRLQVWVDIIPNAPLLTSVQTQFYCLTAIQTHRNRLVKHKKSLGHFKPTNFPQMASLLGCETRCLSDGHRNNRNTRENPNTKHFSSTPK